LTYDQTRSNTGTCTGLAARQKRAEVSFCPPPWAFESRLPFFANTDIDQQSDISRQVFTDRASQRRREFDLSLFATYLEKDIVDLN
jgi:hypothetical protein